jgi:hypothetical protein
MAEFLVALADFDRQRARATYGDDLMDRFARRVPRVPEPVAA